MGEAEGVAGEKITGSSNSTWNEPALSQREKANQLGFRPAELKEVSLMLTHHPNAEPVESAGQSTAARSWLRSWPPEGLG